MRAVAAVPAVALLAGSGIGLVVPEAPRAIAYALMVAAAAGAVVALRYDDNRWLAASVAVGFMAGGVLLAGDTWQQARESSLRRAFDEIARGQRTLAVASGRIVPEDPSAFAFVEGRLRSDASTGAAGVSLRLDVDRIRGPDGDRAVSGGLIVNVGGSLAVPAMGQWRAGRRVRLPVDLRRAARYLDEGVPDGERSLQLRGVSLLGSVKSAALVETLEHAGWLDEGLARVRARTREVIADAVGRWSTRSAAIVAAIVIGDRAGLDDDVERRLQAAGTYHVIAISGGNIAILAGLIVFAFRVAGLLGRTAMLASIGLLVVYARLVGGGASVDRATLMAAVYLAARAADQRSPPLNALAVVAVCLVAADPLSVADPAFLLTFGATLAILAIAPTVSSARLPRPVAAGVALLSASAATEVLLMPIGALFFSRVTFAGLALNFLAIPLMAVTQVAGMAVVPAAFVGRWLSLACGAVAHIGAAGLVWSADLVRFAPWVTFRVAPPASWCLTVYYGALLAWWRTRSPLALAAAGISAFWILAQPWTLLSARGDGRLHVTFFDVGQGDSAFLRLPCGSTLLVDTGGLALPAGPPGSAGSAGFDIGDRVVAPPLRLAGVRRLDYLVLTHGDPDHIGGASSVLREFGPRAVWEGIPVPRFEPLSVLRQEADGLGLRWVNVTRGVRASVDDVTVTVEHPEMAEWERQRVRNDDSVVLDLRWRDVSIVLTGDIGKAVEASLTGRLPPAPLRVLKVPHHGSLTSSSVEFIRALRPRIAVASAGRANRFGHPNPEVVKRYEEAGVELFRTDQDGAVTIDTDGYSLEVHTFTGRRRLLPATAFHEDTKTTKP
jgi:competence protein ComEC